jgi:DGQHR domain-containing protein
MSDTKQRQVTILKVRQWLPGWNKIDFDAEEHRARPPAHFYLFSLPASELKSLSGIARRQAKNAAPRTDDLGIQRQHDPDRSEEILRFVEYGYPWSILSEAKRLSAEFNDLRKPGWLPTAVVINILTERSERNGATVADGDLATISEKDGVSTLHLPYEKWTPSWSPVKLPPFEVIDGQHRLWAFEGATQFEGFDLPVVAFAGLDISWQAYLFWTINIKPKRINASLAFDLYPLLRSEDWLDRAEGHAIYRETRAQELTEVLWSHPASPWYDRINMLGERQNPWVSQSAWIKSLIATFVRSWDRRTGSTGGLFGGRSKSEGEVLGWSRAQQAAFLIYIWISLRSCIAKSKAQWAVKLRGLATQASEEHVDPILDRAFYGPYSLINTDQGVRGYLQVVNDMCYRRASLLKLNRWRPDEKSPSTAVDAVDRALKELESQDFVAFVFSIAQSLADFDWRTSSAPDLDEQQRRAKLVFRGSSGYKELRTQLLEHLTSYENEAANVAGRLIEE